MAHALLSAQRSYDSNPYVFLLRILHNTVVDMSTGH
jgi:DNA-directed RNA polymerase specialized sigma24 family protein